MLFVCCFTKNETWFNFLPALNSAGNVSISSAFQTNSVPEFQPRVSVFRNNLWCFYTTWNVEVKTKKWLFCFVLFFSVKRERWYLIQRCQTMMGSFQSSSDIYFFYDALVGQCSASGYLSQMKSCWNLQILKVNCQIVSFEFHTKVGTTISKVYLRVRSFNVKLYMSLFLDKYGLN